jgi:hypothetical protein
MEFKDKRSIALLLVIGVVLIFVAGFRPVGIDRDSLNYASVLQFPLGEISLLANEPFFLIIIFVNHVLFGAEPRTFFLIFAMLGVSWKLFAINKVGTFPVLSVVTYVFLYFVLHEMTQIRVGVAAAIFLTAIPDIFNKNKRGFVLKTLLAACFHYSAVMMIPLYFLEGRKFNKIAYLALPVVGLVCAAATSVTLPMVAFLIGLLPESISYKLNIYVLFLTEDDQSHITLFNPYYVSLTLLYVLLVANYRLLKGDYDILLLKIFGFALLAYFALSFVPVFSFRVAEFLGVVLVILIPNTLRMFSGKFVPAFIAAIWMAGYFYAIMLGQNLSG